MPRFRAYRTAPAGREHGEKEKNEEHPGFGRVSWPHDDHAVAAVMSIMAILFDSWDDAAMMSVRCFHSRVRRKVFSLGESFD